MIATLLLANGGGRGLRTGPLTELSALPPLGHGFNDRLDARLNDRLNDREVQ